MTFSDPARNLRALGNIDGKAIGDFGAGPGFYTLVAAERVGPRGKIFAVEIQRELVEAVAHRAAAEGFEKEVRAVWGDIDEPNGTGLADDSLDIGILSNVLFLLEKKDVAAEELSRVLKPKSQLLVIDWKDSFGGIGPAKDAIVSPEEVKALFTKEGYTASREWDVGEHHWGLLLERTS